MSTKQHLAYAFAFLALNIVASWVAHALSHSGRERALNDAFYEDATDAELAAASIDPVVCVAANTESGCG